jgi:F-type H+-transporting ATPase subunit 6
MFILVNLLYILRLAGGQLVDASPELQKEMKNELDRVKRVYGGGEGIDMTQFPTFNFPEPKIDPINNS